MLPPFQPWTALPRRPRSQLAQPSPALTPPQALTRWGGALLELAHFRQGPEAVAYIDAAVGKFEAALAIDARKHDALWCLGNALTSQGFLHAEKGAAMAKFAAARACFERAVAEEPGNEVYRKALEMTARAPALHAELQRQFASQGAGEGPRREEEEGPSGSGDDLFYTIGGWALLAALVAGWAVVLSRNTAAQ